MDYPIFHLDFFGNRMLIAVIAILHVIINHGLAVGFIPLISSLELYAFKKNKPEYDKIAHKMMFVAFLITTTVGALTGVGIWFSASLINPYSISSLIKIFYWGWFFEWIIFITEVCLILYYFLTWKEWSKDPVKKIKHIKLGYALALFSWITMAVIVAILGFMMDPSNWLTDKSFLSGIFNRMYLPQLAFRTPLAMMEAGCIAIFLTIIFAKKMPDVKAKILRFLGLWTVFFTPFVLLGGYWYYKRIPDAMVENIPMGLFTGQFSDWHAKFLMFLFCFALIFLIFGQFLIIKPLSLPALVVVMPFFFVIWLTGHFERVREFIRKPFVIGKYMYANGIRVEDYPLLQKEGILSNSAYFYPLTKQDKQRMQDVDPKMIDKIEKGKNVFLIACSRCHTTDGLNSLKDKFEKLLGKDEWQIDDISNYAISVHTIQSYMPPFAGTKEEADYLAYFVAYLKNNKIDKLGSQNSGVEVNQNSNIEKQIFLK